MKVKKMEASLKASDFLQELIQAKDLGMKIYFIQEGSTLKTLPLFEKDLSEYEIDQKYRDRNPNPSLNSIHEYCFIRRKQ
jgi:hypothetical protein